MMAIYYFPLKEAVKGRLWQSESMLNANDFEEWQLPIILKVKSWSQYILSKPDGTYFLIDRYGICLCWHKRSKGADAQHTTGTHQITIV